MPVSDRIWEGRVNSPIRTHFSRVFFFYRELYISYLCSLQILTFIVNLLSKDWSFTPAKEI